MTVPTSRPGRDGETAAIQRIWDDVRTRRRSRAVLVTGDAGTGKSRLVAAALPRLDPEPATVLAGAAAEGTPAPYDWLATVLRSRPALLPDDRPGSADALAWLTHSRQAPPTRLEPTALLRAAVDVVRRMLSGRPGVLVVDDLHALDPASIGLIGELYAAHDITVLLLIAGRQPDGGHVPKPAAGLWKRLDETGTATRLRLDASDMDSTADEDAAFARYLHALGRYRAGAVAALHGAARLIDADRAGDAIRLIDDCLDPVDGTVATDNVQLALASTLVRLQRFDTAATVLARAPGDGGDTLRSITDLTAREREVLRCLTAGMTNRQIARSLGISIRTAAVHVSNLLRKTGTSSRTEAALWAVQHGLE